MKKVEIWWVRVLLLLLLIVVMIVVIELYSGNWISILVVVGIVCVIVLRKLCGC